MKNLIKIKQHDITDCGSASLCSVCAFYGLKMPLSKIRQLASTDQKGTNILGIIEAAEKLGFFAKGVKGSYECLTDIPKPAIAHIVVNKVLKHFVVIYKVSKKFITVMDPADGRLHKINHDKFKNEWTGILILISPGEKFTPGNYKENTWSRFLKIIKPHKSIMIQAFFGATIYSLLGLSTSIYVQNIVDHVLVNGNNNLLNIMSIIMLGILAMKIFISIMKNIFALNTGQKIDASLILGYYQHLLTLPQQFFDTMRTGEIISRLSDAVKIRSFINNVSLDLLVNTLIVFFTFILMFVYSWKLTIVVLISIPLFIAIYIFLNKVNKKYLRRIMENSADLESHLVESLNAASTIKHFGVENFSNIKTEVRFVQLLKSTYYNTKCGILSGGFSELTAGLIIIVLLWFGASRVIANEITPGTLLSFYALAGYIISPLLGLISANHSIQDALIAADRLFQIMDIEREASDENKIILTPDNINDIHFRNVTFRYGSRTMVFENLNLCIEKGKTTAIVGESGSGKTSLVALLQNLYTIQEGNIEIGKYNLKYISNPSLRKIIGVVPQHIDLFAGTIIENIALGEFEPDMQKIIDVSEKLQIREFIENLPLGFYTYIGEHGVSLSGGEKQKIAIARALYKIPEILILDEATSSLDPESENYVKTVVDSLKNQNKTIIIITHRLSTIKYADKICVLHKGKIMEEGSHNQLINNKGMYYNLLQKQISMIEENAYG